MYCSLQDAWPDIQNKQSSFQNQSLLRSEENNINSNRKYNMKIENFNNNNNNTCKYILEHINNCSSCRLKFIQNKNNIFSSLDINPEYKETIIVFLIGIIIILLLNLFIK